MTEKRRTKVDFGSRTFEPGDVLSTDDVEHLQVHKDYLSSEIDSEHELVEDLLEIIANWRNLCNKQQRRLEELLSTLSFMSYIILFMMIVFVGVSIVWL